MRSKREEKRPETTDDPVRRAADLLLTRIDKVLDASDEVRKARESLKELIQEGRDK